MTNGQVRAWYNDQIARIAAQDAELATAGSSLDARARQAFANRHQARITARDMMASKEDVQLLEARDVAIYGRPDGPTFQNLFEKHQVARIPTDEIYRIIIDSASRTNSEFDRRFEAP